MRSPAQHVITRCASADADTVRGPVGPIHPQRQAQRNGYATGPWIPGSAPLTWRSLGYAQAPTFQSGCCSAANAPKTPFDHSGCGLLLSGSIHTPHGQARQNPGDHRTIEVPGLTYGSRPDEHGRVPRHRPLEAKRWAFLTLVAAGRTDHEGARRRTRRCVRSCCHRSQQ